MIKEIVENIEDDDNYIVALNKAEDKASIVGWRGDAQDLLLESVRSVLGSLVENPDNENPAATIRNFRRKINAILEDLEEI